MTDHRLPDFPDPDLTRGPRIFDAWRRLQERKRAAGVYLPERPDEADGILMTRNPGILAGTDLTADEVDNYTIGMGRAAWPVAASHGFITAAGSVASEGLLVGLELAALRRQEEGIDQDRRNLRRALRDLADLILEVDDVQRLNGSEGGRTLLARAEAIVETIR
jgi:hypothetical protein